MFEIGWGSLTFTVNTEPPFDATLTVAEMTERMASVNVLPYEWRSHEDKTLERPRPQPFVQPVSNQSRNYESILDDVDGVYKTLNHPTPDLFYLSPMVGNCLALEILGRSRSLKGSRTKKNPQIAPKLLLVPINPLLPPPYRVVPNYAEWHAQRLARKDARED